MVNTRKYESLYRRKQADTTRRALLAAGRAEFCSEGFGPTTIDGLCDRAGLTRGAFYKHFADKEALFEEVLREIARELVEHVWRRSFELASNRSERERFAVRLFVERVSAADTHRILVLDGPAVLGHERWTRILEDSIFAPLRSAIAGWSERGFVPTHLAEPLTHLLAGLFQVAATRVAVAGAESEASREYEEALLFVIRSLRGERGSR